MQLNGDLIGLALVYGYVLLVVVISFIMKKRWKGDARRKFVHIAVGNIVFFWWIFDNAWVMAFLAAAPFIPLLLLVSPYSPIPKLRESILGQTSEEGHGLGLVMYAISWTILAYLFFENRIIASIGIVAMSYGDGFGGYIGKRYGKRKILRNKTLEGTFAVFLATTISAFLIIEYYGFLYQNGFFSAFIPALAITAQISLLTGVFVSIIELITPGDIDNLVIPLITSWILYFLGI
jgi:dolichol kinase